MRPSIPPLALRTVLAVGVLLFEIPANADTFVLETAHPYVGWFNSIGEHFANNANTLTGRFSSQGVLVDSNSFYVWDISSLAGLTVSAVSLTIRQSAYVSDDPSEVMEIYDVSTNASNLLLDYTCNPWAEPPALNQAGIAIYNDLGSGSLYGSFASYGPTNAQMHTVSLNSAAISDLNASITDGWFGIGLHLATISPDATYEALKFGDSGGRIYQLTVEAGIPEPEPVPEPSTLILSTVGLLGLACVVQREQSGE